MTKTEVLLALKSASESLLTFAIEVRDADDLDEVQLEELRLLDLEIGTLLSALTDLKRVN